MQIKKVNTYHVRSNLAEPFGFSQFYYTQRENLLIEVVSDSGMAGWGSNPDRSVVDSWGRCHDVKNPLIVDGSIFAASAAVNPTSTIQALALYVRNCIKKNRRRLFD